MKQTNGNSEPIIERELPGRLYTREDFPEKSVVSVLVPVSPASVQPHQIYEEANVFEYEPIAAPKLTHKKYGQMLGSPQAQYDAVHRHESEFHTTSTLKLSSGHYISFFSYRVSLPFFKFAPVSFPSFPLPGIFTTVIVLLAMVWIAILTIGLVEFGNYLWNGSEATGQREIEGESGSGDQDYELAQPGEILKEPMQMVGIPSTLPEDLDYNEESSLLPDSSDYVPEP